MSYGSKDLVDWTDEVIDATKFSQSFRGNVPDLITIIKLELDQLLMDYEHKRLNESSSDSCSRTMQEHNSKPMSIGSTRIADILIRTLHLADKLKVNPEHSLRDKIYHTKW